MPENSVKARLMYAMASERKPIISIGIISRGLITDFTMESILRKI